MHIFCFNFEDVSFFLVILKVASISGTFYPGNEWCCALQDQSPIHGLCPYKEGRQGNVHEGLSRTKEDQRDISELTHAHHK